MRLTGFIALLTLMCAALCGCQATGELENKAYVLVLGVDRLDDGRLELTARVPKVGKSTESKGESASGGSPYLTFRASGDTWVKAQEALEQATPRQANLSHIEMLVVSRKLAEEPSFPTLMRRIAENPHLYTTARFVVCGGDARSFVEAGNTVIGTRMSAEIRAMLKHYAAQGYVPDSSFAEACYLADSIYSDPVAIYADLTDSTEAQGKEDQVSPMRQRFPGVALFREGAFVGALDTEQTRLLNLIRGSVKTLPLDCDGRSFELTPEGKPDRRVEFTGEGTRLVLSVRLSTLDDACSEDAAQMEQKLREGMKGVIQACQRLGCDPFGFSEAAAGHFATVPEWLSFDWRARYAAADVEVRVEVCSKGTS